MADNPRTIVALGNGGEDLATARSVISVNRAGAFIFGNGEASSGFHGFHHCADMLGGEHAGISF